MEEITNVLEIFNSLSGEVSLYHQGVPATFVRLARCNLACDYCDTPLSQTTGTAYKMEDLLKAVRKFYGTTGKLCITGGEPLLQGASVLELIRNFKKSWIETNGTVDFSFYIGITSIVADYKLYHMTTIPYYFYNLLETDFVKFVVDSPEQFLQAANVQRLLQIGGCKAFFAYSPIHEKVKVSDLLTWMEQFMLPNTIINIQLHKYLGLK